MRHQVDGLILLQPVSDVIGLCELLASRKISFLLKWFGERTSIAVMANNHTARKPFDLKKAAFRRERSPGRTIECW